MTEYNITFKLPDGTEETVTCAEDQYILDAGEEAGVDLPYSCRAGACSACTGKIVDGEIDDEEQTFLDDDQIEKGFALLCCSYPKSDLVIETEQEENL